MYKTVQVLIGEDKEGVPREVVSNWTCRYWLDEIYSALESAGEFDDLLQGRDKFTFYAKSEEYRYHKNCNKTLGDIAHFEWAKPSSKP